jgi:hypothetical protein
MRSCTCRSSWLLPGDFRAIRLCRQSGEPRRHPADHRGARRLCRGILRRTGRPANVSLDATDSARRAHSLRAPLHHKPSSGTDDGNQPARSCGGAGSTLRRRRVRKRCTTSHGILRSAPTSSLGTGDRPLPRGLRSQGSKRISCRYEAEYYELSPSAPSAARPGADEGLGFMAADRK